MNGKKFDRNWMALPYYPQRYDILRRGKIRKSRFALKIAYTDVMRGDDYDVPTLLFCGAPFLMIKSVCEYFYSAMKNNIHDIKIQQEHSCRNRNGKCYWRIAVQIMGLNEKFISLNGFILMLISKIEKTFNCVIRHCKTDVFLNL